MLNFFKGVFNNSTPTRQEKLKLEQEMAYAQSHWQKLSERRTVLHSQLKAAKKEADRAADVVARAAAHLDQLRQTQEELESDLTAAKAQLDAAKAAVAKIQPTANRPVVRVTAPKATCSPYNRAGLGACVMERALQYGWGDRKGFERVLSHLANPTVSDRKAYVTLRAFAEKLPTTQRQELLADAQRELALDDPRP